MKTENFVTPSVLEDKVNYHIYIDPQNKQDRKELLKEFINYSNSFIPNEYVWQNESFNLNMKDENVFVGTTKVGDNIEDEWFIVFILFELSKKYDFISIKVWDNDGDFLLIEAALHLPDWLEPENSMNRVFIRRGEVHIIPKPENEQDAHFLPSEDEGIQDVNRALEIIRCDTINTKASPKLNECIKTRISGYPKLAKEYMHTVRCFVPLQIAQLLRHDKQHVAQAVKAFYERDMISLQHANKMSRFPPETSVMTMVTFNRVLYAQLLQQRYAPPKRFPKLPPSHHPDYKAMDLGMKLAIGFEILYQQSKLHSTRDANQYDFNSDPKWKKYLKNLKTLNYFRNELEGSKKYKELLEQAKEAYLTGGVSEDYSKKVDEILSQIKETKDEFEKSQKIVPDDSDNWMTNSTELEEILKQRQQELDELNKKESKGQKKIEKKDLKQQKKEKFEDQATNIITGMTSFMKGETSYEGVEPPTDENTPAPRLDSLISMMNNLWKEDQEEYMKRFGAIEEDMNEDELNDRLMKEMSDWFNQSEEENEEFDEEMKGYMEALDDELQKYTKEDLKEGDVHLNLLENLMKSMKAQPGEPNPGQLLLKHYGVDLDELDLDDVE